MASKKAIRPPPPPALRKCPKCHYRFWSQASAERISCPSCHHKFYRPTQKLIVLLRDFAIKTRCSICGKNRGIYDVCELNGAVVILCPDCLKDLKKKPGQRPLPAPVTAAPVRPSPIDDRPRLNFGLGPQPTARPESSDLGGT